MPPVQASSTRQALWAPLVALAMPAKLGAAVQLPEVEASTQSEGSEAQKPEASYSRTR